LLKNQKFFGSFFQKRTSFFSFAKSGTWLTRERANLYGHIFALAALVLLLAFYGRILAAPGRPIASDFDAFWSGARLALRGDGAAAYVEAPMRAAESQGAQLAPGQWFVYLYPPTFMLLSLPLGGLPYLAALALFLVVSFAAWALCVRRILPAPWPLLPLLAFPVGCLNALVGQNGFMSAACFGTAMLLIDRWPVAAGVSLGLLAFKPHLAIAVPFVLLAARRFAALAACGITALFLAALSWAVLGGTVWHQALQASAVAGPMLLSTEVWPKLMSVYAGLRLLHTPAFVGYGGQGLAGLAALIAAVCLAERRPGGALEIASMVPAAMLCTPYVWDYDLVCLSLPMAWLARCAARDGWRPWEKTVLAALYGGAVAARLVNVNFGIPFMPILIAALLALTVQRGLAPAHQSWVHAAP